MRINSKEISLIQLTLSRFLNKLDFKVFLFGSRTDDKKKGGDIDLLLLCSEKKYDSILDQKNIIKAELEFALDDQRVDLTIATEEKIKNDLFLTSINESMIELKAKEVIHDDK